MTSDHPRILTVALAITFGLAAGAAAETIAGTGLEAAESTVRSRSVMTLVVDGGIDCILARHMTGSGKSFSAAPSDHPAVIATFAIGD